MSENKFDLTIIGAGPGGYEAAFKAAEKGLKTAVVEKYSAPGGTCLHRGCIPTKAFLHTADVIEELESARRIGIKTSEFHLEMEGLQKRKKQIIDMQAKGISEGFAKRGVTLFSGFGSLASENYVSVSLSEETEIKIETKSIIIATGSSVRSFAGLIFDGKRVLSSDDMLELTEVPKSLIVIGAGAVGVEFASVMARFGCKVALVEAMPHILPYNDEEIAAQTSAGLKRQKIKIYEAHPLASLEASEQGVMAILKSPEGAEVKLEAEKALISVGRKPNTENIGLETLGIETERGFVKVNRFMQTNIPNIYAIGDIVPTSALAHTAYAEGWLAVEHILGEAKEGINYEAIPFCVYAKPESAGVGLTEKQARERFGEGVVVGRFDMGANGKAAILNQRAGLVKVVASKGGALLGAHIVGAMATEIIGEFGLAIQNKLSLKAIAQTVHAHPTVYESLHFAVEDAIKKL